MGIMRLFAEGGGHNVRKKLGRLLRPGMVWYFAVLVIFCGAALYVGQYWLAAAEAVATLLVFLLFTMVNNRRARKLRQYMQSVSNTLEGMGQGEPLPRGAGAAGRRRHHLGQ